MKAKFNDIIGNTAQLKPVNIKYWTWDGDKELLEVFRSYGLPVSSVTTNASGKCDSVHIRTSSEYYPYDLFKFVDIGDVIFVNEDGNWNSANTSDFLLNYITK